MILQSNDGEPVHIPLLDGSAICIHEAREVPDKFVRAALKTGRVAEPVTEQPQSKPPRKQTAHQVPKNEHEPS